MANRHMTISLRELRDAINSFNVESYDSFAEEIFAYIEAKRRVAINDTSVTPTEQSELDFGDDDGTNTRG